MVYKVILWSSGNAGLNTLRVIMNHPELELVGVVVNDPAKAGKDAAELCGLNQVSGITGLKQSGIIATTDFQALLDQGADCVCYTAAGSDRFYEAMVDIKAILSAGINVVSSSVIQVFPECSIPEFIEPIKAACEIHKVSFLGSGIDPGFTHDIMPLMLSGLSEQWHEIRLQVIANHASNDQEDTLVLREMMGFGKPMDHLPYLLDEGILSLAWGDTLRSVAAGVRLQLDDIKESYQRLPAERDLETPVGTIKKGTCAALRFEVKGYVDGRTPIVLEHVTRMYDDIAPDWPQGKGYKVIVEGEPRMEISRDTADQYDGDHAAGCVLQTASRLVNAIPAVVEHTPGMMSSLDLPLIGGKGLYRPKALEPNSSALNTQKSP